MSCGELSPTELLLDDPQSGLDEYEVEVLANDSDDPSLENGYDSTGVVIVPSNKAALISLSAVKNSFENFAIHKFHGAAVFFDRSQPIKTPDGRRLGYKTFAAGKVFFNAEKARLNPMIAKYRDGGVRKDTLLGYFFALNKLISRHGIGMANPYNSQIQFRYINSNAEKNKLNISVPEEITASIKSTAKPGEKNFELKISWRGTGKGKVEIILGGIRHKSRSSIPLYRIRVKDKGKFTLKKELLSKIPFEQYDKFVVTVMRKLVTKGTTSENSSDYLITAQSIHNIFFNIN